MAVCRTGRIRTNGAGRQNFSSEQKAKYEERGTLLASGFIAGEAITGILLAFLFVAGIPSLTMLLTGLKLVAAGGAYIALAAMYAVNQPSSKSAWRSRLVATAPLLCRGPFSTPAAAHNRWGLGTPPLAASPAKSYCNLTNANLRGASPSPFSPGCDGCTRASRLIRVHAARSGPKTDAATPFPASHDSG